MKITPMKREDLARYIQVFLSAFGGEPWNEPWTAESAAARLGGYMDTGSAFGLAMEENGELIAFILGQFEPYYDGPRFFIQEFCCARRSGGYGTKLLAELEEQLKAQGVVRTYLMTSHTDATEGFYQRRGYTTDPENILMYKIQ